MNKGLLEYRAVFILMIFLFHAGVLPIGGTFGVSAFFILSGFCTVLGYRDRVSQKGFNYLLYLRKRYVKYYPLHWLLLFIILIMEFYRGFSISNNGLQLAANFFLVQSLIPIKDYFFSFNAVSWYLSDTVFFVALAPVILLIFNKFKRGGVILLIILSLFAISLFCWLPKEYIQPIIYINPIVRLSDFVYGVWLAYVYESIIKSKVVSWVKQVITEHPIIYPILVAVVLCVSIMIYNRIKMVSFLGVIYWLPCTIILLLCSFCSLNKIGFIGTFGSISFEFFMIHQLCINAFTSMQMAGLFTINNLYVSVIVEFVIATILAYLLHRFFTKPIVEKLLIKHTRNNT